jgi:superfamily II DNA/RNA helicase
LKQFNDLGLNQSLLKVLPELGIIEPTEIQKEAIPSLINGNTDFVGLAQTGTGKTAAFGLPLLQNINPEQKGLQALIVVPTRELSQQVATQLVALSKYLNGVKVLAIYGGQPVHVQMNLLRQRPQVIIATPGRLIDMIDRKAISLKQVQTVVLDEADEMLNMGFQEDIDKILEFAVNKECTWLFSATMSNEIRGILKKYMNEPLEVNVNKGEKVNVNIEHTFIKLRGNQKNSAIEGIMDSYPDMRAVIFCRTKADTRDLAALIVDKGYPADALHGDLSQNQRDRVMKKFRAQKLRFLIATDVAARGIDVNDLTHVIHYALPDELEYYTHRSGRTARAGKKGTSIALVSGKDLGRIDLLKRKLNISFTEFKLDTPLAMSEPLGSNSNNGYSRERNSRDSGNRNSRDSRDRNSRDSRDSRDNRNNRDRRPSSNSFSGEKKFEKRKKPGNGGYAGGNGFKNKYSNDKPTSGSEGRFKNRSESKPKERFETWSDGKSESQREVKSKPNTFADKPWKKSERKSDKKGNPANFKKSRRPRIQKESVN